MGTFGQSSLIFCLCVLNDIWSNFDSGGDKNNDIITSESLYVTKKSKSFSPNFFGVVGKSQSKKFPI